MFFEFMLAAEVRYPIHFRSHRNIQGEIETLIYFHSIHVVYLNLMFTCDSIHTLLVLQKIVFPKQKIYSTKQNKNFGDVGQLFS